MHRRWKTGLNGLTGILSLVNLALCLLLLVTAVDHSPSNHSGYDIRLLYFFCAATGLWGGIALRILRLNRPLSVVLLCLTVVLTFEVLLFDQCNILVEYSEWLDRGMPSMWER